MKFFYRNELWCSPPVRLIVTLRGGDMQIRSAQKLAWDDKVAKGFNTTDPRWSSACSGVRSLKPSTRGARAAKTSGKN